MNGSGYKRRLYAPMRNQLKLKAPRKKSRTIKKKKKKKKKQQQQKKKKQTKKPVKKRKVTDIFGPA